MTTRSFLGTIFEVPERKLLNIIEDALIIVGADGTIESVLSKLSPEYNEKKKRAEKDGSLIVLQKGQYILPGLIDLHVHAPQWPQLGKALDRPLEEWLNDCTFPLEAKYADIAFATEVYDSLVSTLLANGTTTAVYYATVHLESSIRLAEICLKHGQRAVVGRVAMDLSSHSPAYYRDESPEASEKLSKDFINAVRGLRDNSTRLVEPAVVPRFIPTCSDEALQRLGNLAKEHACYIQTHCSESDWEHHHVLSRFNKSDAFALDSFGLVTPRTVLAHCNYLSDEDMDLIKSRGAAVAHCPLSNLYFSDAVFPLKKALDRELHVGLGTDISGGPSPSLMEVSRFAVGVSRALDDGVDPSMPIAERRQTDTARVDHVEAFYVATTKGGEALGKKIGRIAPGYSFDAIVVDVNAEHGNIRVFPQVDSMADVFQKIVYNLTPSNIIRTFVGGRVAHEQKS